MEIFVSLSAIENSDYIQLCDIDAKIRDEEGSQREWTPGMINASEESLIFPRRLRNMYKRRIGLDNISGPFFRDGYFDGKTKITELPK